MGYGENASASIGISIKISDLVDQIDGENIDLIKDMLQEGHIKDEDDYYNTVFDEIMQQDIFDEISDYLALKEFLTKEFTEKGTYIIERNSELRTPSISDGCLFDKILLIPVKDILTCMRSGRDGVYINSVSRPIDFDMFADMEKYKNINNTQIVFILTQCSG
jgi:hypothetical protein